MKENNGMLWRVGFLACIGGLALASVASADNRVSASKKGSLLAYTKIEIKWDADGNVTQDTFLSIINDYPADVFTHWLFVNGDEPTDEITCCDPEEVIERAHPGWNKQNWSRKLTHDQPLYFSALTGGPVGAPRFPELDDDGIGGPGRPDPEALDGSRLIRGFAYAWAVDSFGNEISWNHLAGSVVIINYANTTADEYEAYSFQTPYDNLGIAPDAYPGELSLDGVEYDICFDRLLLDFYAVGSNAFDMGTITTMVNTDLTVLPMVQDLRQDNNGPIITKIKADVWNQNEDFFSGTDRCITCWNQALLSSWDSPNNWLKGNLHTNKGKARLNGEYSPTVCGPYSMNVPILAIARKEIAFSGTVEGLATTAMTVVGQGEEPGQIWADVVDPPGTLTDSEEPTVPTQTNTGKGSRGQRDNGGR
jgi:hypothetical protein